MSLPIILINIGELIFIHLKFAGLLLRLFFLEICKRQWNSCTRILTVIAGEILFYFLRVNYNPSSIIMSTMFAGICSAWRFVAIYNYYDFFCDVLTMHHLYFCCSDCYETNNFLPLQ